MSFLLIPGEKLTRPPPFEKLPNPLPLLPPNLFRELLKYLPSNQVAQCTSINREWRRSIQSSEKEVFSDLVLGPKFGYQGVCSKPKEEKETNDLIKRVEKVSQSSDHQLKSASIYLYGFQTDLSLITSSWESTKLSNLLLTLSTCSSIKTLKSLHLQAPYDYADEFDPSDVTNQVLVILKKLECLPNLINVELEASTLLDVVSKSKSKTLSILGGPSDLDIPREADEYESPEHKTLLKECKRFTGGTITSIKAWQGIRVEEEILEELLQPKGSLKEVTKLDLELAETSIKEEAFELAFRCPNLTTLTLGNANSEIYSAWFFPSDLPANLKKSKIRVLHLNMGDGVIYWLDPFFKWMGDALENVDIGFKCHITEREPIFRSSIYSFLNPSSSTLKYLHLMCFVLTTKYERLPSKIVFPNLRELNLMGNKRFIDFFTQEVEYKALIELDLTVERYDNEGSFLNVEEVFEIIKGCRETLTDIGLEEDAGNMEDWGNGEWTDEEVEMEDLEDEFDSDDGSYGGPALKNGDRQEESSQKEQEDGRELVHLSNLHSLAFRLHSKSTFSPYLSLRCPKVIHLSTNKSTEQYRSHFEKYAPNLKPELRMI